MVSSVTHLLSDYFKSFVIVITDRKYRTDSSIISMSGLKKIYSKMSQMLDITTPRKSNFSEGADLRTPKEGILLSTQQKVNSIQPPT